MKYKLTNDSKTLSDGTIVYRIECVTAFGNIKAGDKGGFIESKNNLSQEGNAWVSGDAWVYGNARVYGNAWVFGNARVYGNAIVYDKARLHGNAKVYGNARISSCSWGKSPLQIQGSVWYFNMCRRNQISIGCETHTIKHWLDNYYQIGKLHNTDDDTIEEYYRYICLARDMYLR